MEGVTTTVGAGAAPCQAAAEKTNLSCRMVLFFLDNGMAAY